MKINIKIITKIMGLSLKDIEIMFIYHYVLVIKLSHANMT